MLRLADREGVPSTTSWSPTPPGAPRPSTPMSPASAAPAGSSSTTPCSTSLTPDRGPRRDRPRARARQERRRGLLGTGLARGRGRRGVALLALLLDGAGCGVAPGSTGAADPAVRARWCWPWSRSGPSLVSPGRTPSAAPSRPGPTGCRCETTGADAAFVRDAAPARAAARCPTRRPAGAEPAVVRHATRRCCERAGLPAARWPPSGEPVSRVLVVTNDFPPRRGGIESFVAGAVRADGRPTRWSSTPRRMPGDRAHDATLPFPVHRDPVGDPAAHPGRGPPGGGGAAGDGLRPGGVRGQRPARAAGPAAAPGRRRADGGADPRPRGLVGARAGHPAAAAPRRGRGGRA